MAGGERGGGGHGRALDGDDHAEHARGEAPPGRARFPGADGGRVLVAVRAGPGRPRGAGPRRSSLGLPRPAAPGAADREPDLGRAHLAHLPRAPSRRLVLDVHPVRARATSRISILTPSQSGGGPGQIYMLTRAAGVSVGTGLTATLISFMGTLVGLLLMGLYSLLISGIAASGFALPRAGVDAHRRSPPVLLLGAAWPDLCRIALAALSRTVWRLLAPARGRHRLVAARARPARLPPSTGWTP